MGLERRSESGLPIIRRRKALRALIGGVVAFGVLVSKVSAEGMDELIQDPKASFEPNNKKLVEEKFRVRFERWTDYYSPNSPLCLVKYSDGLSGVSDNLCEATPLEFDETRIEIMGGALNRLDKYLPKNAYEGAIFVPAAVFSRSFVLPDNPDVINLQISKVDRRNPHLPLLIAHELGHRKIFSGKGKISKNDKGIAEMVESVYYDPIYKILGGVYNEPPLFLVEFVRNFEQQLKEDPSLNIEGSFGSIGSGIKYLTEGKYPTEVWPVLVEWVLRPSFDQSVSKDYLIKSLRPIFGEGISRKLYQHTIDYFFEGKPPLRD